MTAPHAREDGSLYIKGGLVVPADEVHLRVTTSGGPGGQHANRSLTRVVATFSISASTSVSPTQRRLLESEFGTVVRSSAGRYRSQGMNRTAALDQLARRIAFALTPPPPRRATRPTRSSQERRVDDKKARGRLKSERHKRDDD